VVIPRVSGKVKGGRRTVEKGIGGEGHFGGGG